MELRDDHKSLTDIEYVIYDFISHAFYNDDHFKYISSIGGEKLHHYFLEKLENNVFEPACDHKIYDISFVFAFLEKAFEHNINWRKIHKVLKRDGFFNKSP